MNWHRLHVSASIALLRTVLFCVNIIFMISGGILILLGIVLRSHFKEFLEITPEMTTSSPYVLICLGLIVSLIGLYAFWCTIKGHSTLLYTYSLIILLIFFAEIALAITVLMRKTTYEQTFKTTVRNIMQQYPRKPMHLNIDHLQTTLSCCGVESYTDWFRTPYGDTLSQVPASCCKTHLNFTCRRTNLRQDHLPSDININGCYPTVLSAIKSNYPIFGGIILVIALFPLLAMIFACCLASQMKKHRYERVD